MALEFRGLTWKLALGFRGFIGKKKLLGLKDWLAAILDYDGHWLAAIDWRPFWIVAAILFLIPDHYSFSTISPIILAHPMLLI